jgi:cytochrome d ubiquinol oxidase subunit I
MSAWFDPVILSRIQFAFLIAVHIIFPTLTIGLASWLVVLEGLWLKTKHPIYKEIYLHWVKIFSVTFGMGVVSGVVMSYQFGTNWAHFVHKIGNIVGPLLTFEVLTAFFLESSFLGVMLFGWHKVSPRMHFFSTLMVAIGTIISSFWILSVNSWMQTPSGYIIDANGIFMPSDWLAIIFNPSFKYRLFHMIFATYLTTAFVVAAASSWYIIKHKFLTHAKIMLTMSMSLALILVPIQMLIGHGHGQNTATYQPLKAAAIEGIWETERGANLNLIGYPDQKTQTTKYAIQIPKMASLMLHGNINSEVKGLKAWPAQDRPPVAPVFFSFRIMVGIGLLMCALALWSLYQYFNGKLYRKNIFHRLCVLFWPSGFIALLCGWITTEVGRQPYIVYGQLLTKDAASAISATQVSISLALFVSVYCIVFGAGIYYIFKLIKRGPVAGDWHDQYGTHGLKERITLGDIFLHHKDLKSND